MSHASEHLCIRTLSLSKTWPVYLPVVEGRGQVGPSLLRARHVLCKSPSRAVGPTEWSLRSRSPGWTGKEDLHGLCLTLGRMGHPVTGTGQGLWGQQAVPTTDAEQGPGLPCSCNPMAYVSPGRPCAAGRWHSGWDLDKERILPRKDIPNMGLGMS